MDIVAQLQSDIRLAIKDIYAYDISDAHLIINPTKKEFEGEYTFVVFPLVKALKKSPQDIADTLGKYLVEHNDSIDAYNVIKGFLNLSLSNDLWINILQYFLDNKNYGQFDSNGKKILIEFSSPNTNKPLHLGHIRNILLGWSMSKIAEANGYEVTKTKVVNDRGIAICKSMLAWRKYADGKTPEDAGVKGDHYVGQYYVQFEKAFQEEYKTWQASAEGEKIYNTEAKENVDSDSFYKKYKNNYFNNYSTLGKEAKEMLLQWESGDEQTKQLWATMNGWVYAGFDKTYEQMGVSFDDIVYESDTYLLGKDLIQDGLDKDIFYKKDDGSIWVNLEDEGLDHKILLRSDGTSVYMTQDLGTARVRYEKYGFDKMTYVVGDEQDYHFQVLFEILKKMGESYADDLYHLSYGMVDLTTGKMKSREGTIVDADDLMSEVIATARQSAEERGGIEGLTDEKRNEIYSKIGLSALKYFIIKINPRKRMTFNPAESLDMQGATGPYIQNAYVRIQSIKRRYDGAADVKSYSGNVESLEKDILSSIVAYPEALSEAMEKYDPSVIANYCYTLAKSFHRFYHEYSILNAETAEIKQYRYGVCIAVANILEKGMNLLGIEMPDYM